MKPQTEKVLRFMRQHGSVTSLDAFDSLGCHRLAARIFEIREAGYHVKKEPKTGKNRFGQTVCYTEYTLQEETNA